MCGHETWKGGKVNVLRFFFPFLLAAFVNSTSIAQQYPPAILSNSGEIGRVFINEIRTGGGLDDVTDSQITSSFLNAGIAVCLVRNILCWGSTVRSAGDCKTASVWDRVEAKDRKNLDELSEEDRTKLISLIERESWLNLKGDFMKVIANGDTMDYEALTMLQRLEVINEFRDDLNGMIWNAVDGVWISKSKSLVIARKSDASVPLVPDHWSSWIYVLAEAWGNGMTVTYVDSTVRDGKIVSNFTGRKDTISWGIVCPDLSQRECEDSIYTQLSQWAQDEYLVRESSSQMLPRLRFDRPESQQRRLQVYSGQLCGNVLKSSVPSLPLQGGNLFYCDSILFIGTDEIVNFKSCKNWASTIGVKDADAVDDIFNGLSCHVAGGVARKVVMVGYPIPSKQDSIPCEGMILGSRHQPIFHIDMFFHPLGQLDSGGVQMFYYIIAEPIAPVGRKWSKSQQQAFDAISRGVRVSDTLVGKQLSDLGLTPRPVKLPLMVDFVTGNPNPRFIAFANGHSSKTEDGFKFYMPSYEEGQMVRFPHLDWSAYQALELQAKDALIGTGVVSVIELRGYFNETSAVHCQSIVIERKRTTEGSK